MKVLLAFAGIAIGFLAFRSGARHTANLPTPTDEILHLARMAEKYRGVQIRVAESLGLSRAHVSLVCRGLRTSRRVEEALANAVRRIQKEAA
jgi:hypothetical protein